MKTTILVSLVIAELLVSVAVCRAYKVYTDSGVILKWPAVGLIRFAPRTVLHPASDQFTTGSDYYAALANAIAAWNQNPSNFRFGAEYDRLSTDMDFENTFSEVWFTDNSSYLSGYDARCAFWTDASGNITEADIVFDADKKNWTTSTVKAQLLHYGGDNRLFQNVALHELGHALGLDHEADEYNIMGLDEKHLHVNGDTATFYPGEDASDGAVSLYGTYPGLISLDGTVHYIQDLGAVHWKYSGVWGGEYSDHERTAVYGIFGYVGVTPVPDPTPRTYHTYNDEPFYYVSPGESVFVEFTFENNGTSEQHPLVKFYYSKDDEITTSDEELASRRPGLWRNNVFTFKQLVTIPASAKSGYRYLGAIINADGAIDGETTPDNNATYVGIMVTERGAE